MLTLLDSFGRSGCRQCRNGVRSPRWIECCGGHIPDITVQQRAYTNLDILGPYHENNSAQITSNLQVTFCHLLSVWNDNSASLTSCEFPISADTSIAVNASCRSRTKSVHNVTTQETGCAENGSGVA